MPLKTTDSSAVREEAVPGPTFEVPTSAYDFRVN